jgi:hypothetical protein
MCVVPIEFARGIRVWLTCDISPPDELHKRYSLFYCIGLIAQAIANVLAFGLGKMEGCRIFEGGDGFSS